MKQVWLCGGRRGCVNEPAGTAVPAVIAGRGRRARDFCAGTATPPPTRAPFQRRMRSWARPQPRVLDPALRWLVSEVGLSWPRRPLPATTGAGRCCESCPPGKEVALGCLFWLRASRRRRRPPSRGSRSWAGEAGGPRGRGGAGGGVCAQTPRAAPRRWGRIAEGGRTA